MKSKLSIFSLTLITVCSVDSIRNLPAAAIAGSQLFNYFTLALIFFLLPCTIVSYWFSNQSQQGIYGWVKTGLGKNAAFMTVWYQCVQNVLIYPTFLSFIAGTLLYSVSPELAENKILLFLIIIILIWGLTWINLKGIQLSSRFNSFCTITGLLVPFALIIIMGLYWWLTQTIENENILPQAAPYSWTSLTAIILSFCGIELAAVHAEESKPGAYPKAIVLSVFIIFLSMLLGSIILAMIIQAEQLNFISSIPQLIQLFFTKMNCAHLAFIVNGLIAIGCIGTANNWLIAPIKGLVFAAREGFINTKLTELNENKAPAKLLILQASCVSIISTLFLIVPSINASYWIMLNAATQIYLLMYVLLFFSALKVASSLKTFKIMIPIFLGLFGISIALLVSLTPPPTLELESQLAYDLLGVAFLILMTLIPSWNQRRIKVF
jgi:amino acid transporter